MVLPLPPSTNTYYRVVNNRIVLSRAGRQYKLDVQAMVGRDGRWPLEARLFVDVVLNFPTLRRCDIDNRIKPLLDALEKADVILDDEQVDQLSVRRGDVRAGGRCLVAIYRLVADVVQLSLGKT